MLETLHGSGPCPPTLAQKDGNSLSRKPQKCLREGHIPPWNLERAKGLGGAKSSGGAVVGEPPFPEEIPTSLWST